MKIREKEVLAPESAGLLKELVAKYSYRPTALPQLASFPQYPARFPVDGGSVHVLLGPPSSGKTSLALHLGMSAAAAGRYVFYAAWDWAAGYISLRTHGWDLPNTGRFLFSDAAALDDIVSAAATLPAQSLFVFDYLQVCPCGAAIPAGYSAGVEGRVSYVCDRIQAAARKEKQIFLLLCAENRMSLVPAVGTAAGTTLHSGYGSSRVEYAADSVTAVRWESDNVLRCTSLKNRWETTQEQMVSQYRLLAPPPHTRTPVPEPKDIYEYEYSSGGILF